MIKNQYIFEACVEGIQQAIKSQQLGANRIELCDNLAVSGTTPSYGLIKIVKKLLSIPVFVIIRPRAGGFNYDSNEIEIMKNDIEACLDLNVDGLVFGILNQDNNKIDLDNMQYLISTIRQYKKKSNVDITFHMAFDLIQDKQQAINQLITLGVNRILTKGSLTNAIDGKDNLKQYIEWSKNQIIIMPGGSITKDNYKIIADYTGCKELHGTKIVGNLQ